MAHTQRDKQDLMNRVRRIRGQLNAVEESLNEEDECYSILQTLAACRGALDSLVYEIIEGHIRYHVVDPDHKPNTRQAQATRELIKVLHSYLK